MYKVLKGLQTYLLQRDAAEAPGFAGELVHLRTTGLRVFSIAAVATPLLMLVAVGVVRGAPLSLPSTLGRLGITGFGAALLAANRTDWGQRRSLLLCWVAVFSVSGLYVWTLVLESSLDTAMLQELAPRLSVVILIGSFVLTLHPLHTLGLGASIEAFYFLSERVAVSVGLLAPRAASEPDVYTVFPVFVLLSTALSAVMYRRTFQIYSSHRSELRATNELRQTHALLVISENAATMGRLAATFCHELNTPVGALSSTLQSLQRLAQRRTNSPSEETRKLERLEEELFLTARDAVERLREIVTRMQRMTNLDRVESFSADLNDLIRDVVAILESQIKDKSTLTLDLSPLPEILVCPQQISAAISNLIMHTVDRVPVGSRITLATRKRARHVEITLADNGPPLSEQEAESIFEPGFAVQNRRVAAAHWSLFSSREMVRRHGGNIFVETPNGTATTTHLILPC